jgi:hypothetical protein
MGNGMDAYGNNLSAVEKSQLTHLFIAKKQPVTQSPTPIPQLKALSDPAVEQIRDLKYRCLYNQRFLFFYLEETRIQSAVQARVSLLGYLEHLSILPRRQKTFRRDILAQFRLIGQYLS